MNLKKWLGEKDKRLVLEGSDCVTLEEAKKALQTGEKVRFTGSIFANFQDREIVYERVESLNFKNVDGKIIAKVELKDAKARSILVCDIKDVDLCS